MDPADAKLAESLAAPAREKQPGQVAEEDTGAGSETSAESGGTVVAWLGLLCGMIDGTTRGVVLMRPGGRSAREWQAVAQWPDADGDFGRLAAVAEGAHEKERTVVRPHPRSEDATAADTHDVAHPLTAGGKVSGVVAVEVSECPEPRLPEVVRHLQSAASYFPLLVGAPSASLARPVSASALEGALWLVGSCLEHGRFRGAATAVATDLAAQAGCERVSIGFLEGKQIKVYALSNSAEFGERMNLIRRIGAAMDEAVDQNASIVVPALDDSVSIGTIAHEELLREEGSSTVCTVLLTQGEEEIIGALTLERDAPFARDEVATLEDTATLLGPILELKRRDDRWLVQKAWDTTREWVGKLFGPHHLGLKVAAAAIVLALAYLSFATAMFRVTAPATLEGAVMRVAVAPIDGFIVEAPARAGDLVEAGTVLAVLDDRDLLLEQRNLQSQRDQVESEYLEAMARQERVEMNLLATRMEQADVQLDLIAEQLSRLTITAPIDGVIVSGDLSQSIGAPVQQGDPLFEVAPLDTYRLMLRVDERDIAYVHTEQRGAVVLAAMPESTHAFGIEKVTPVSSSEEGTTYFLVEAAIDEATPMLRPGMEGVGKIDVEESRLIWILTRRLTDWFRLWSWSWWGPGA